MLHAISLVFWILHKILADMILDQEFKESRGQELNDKDQKEAETLNTEETNELEDIVVVVEHKLENMQRF